MSVSYNRLWKLLIDKEMSKTEVIQKAGISTNAMAHLGKNEDVRVSVLVKICAVLGCTFDDIMEIKPD
ncbi:MAG: helix-turn-helix transcriptional regulator [Oscillospiraceae bacterium]|nr:helix-turn-helix transcriptional regulator [Oscillospiraceae bacterium]